MSNYLRPNVPGATVFFTMTLAERGSRLLVDEIARLRAAVRRTRVERPFHIDAWVVLPDHLHAVWTLPEGDHDFSTRWGAIKSRFTRSLRDDCRVGFHPTLAKETGHAVGWNPTLRRSESKRRKRDAGIWQRRFWEHHVRGPEDYDAVLLDEPGQAWVRGRTNGLDVFFGASGPGIRAFESRVECVGFHPPYVILGLDPRILGSGGPGSGPGRRGSRSVPGRSMGWARISCGNAFAHW